MRFFCGLLSALFLNVAFARESFTVGTELNLGFYGAPTAPEFALDTVDRYGGNWRGLQIPLSTARSYERIDPFFAIFLEGAYKDFQVRLDFPLRKDLEAWYDDNLKTNVTLNPSNLDINVPLEGFAKWDYGAGFIQFGRFKPELGPSPHTLALGGAPYHDALWWKFEPNIFRYDFLFSSLNAHLHGTPATLGAAPPEGSEAWEQAHWSVDNQRNRSYTEPYKNLVYHRLGVEFSRFWFYVVEQSVIGGKQAEFRTINPFMFWHDNFAAGYTKSNVVLEMGARPIRGSAFYWQMAIEEVKSPVGEKDVDSRGIVSYLVGYSQEIPTQRFGDFKYRLDLVYTDPAYGNERLPLLKYTSRRMYRSNYRDREDADFADMYFVDYPLGYVRGSDAIDLWLTTGWKYKQHEVSLELAWLRQGDKGTYADYDEALQSKKPLSGVVERQYLADILYSYRLMNAFSVFAGGGGRKYRNLSHEQGENGQDFWFRAGVKVSFSYTVGASE
ncbi:MAG: hypothetical protein LBR60_06985 [Fibrobacter sp.]|jgi:hypothetical protein|nr:hypothetical protein [Fibrobacter sp.]